MALINERHSKVTERVWALGLDETALIPSLDKDLLCGLGCLPDHSDYFLTCEMGVIIPSLKDCRECYIKEPGTQ